MNMRTILVAIAVLALAGCGGSNCLVEFINSEPGEPVDLGVDEDLHDLVELSGYPYEYLAVGAAGRIVKWGREDGELLVETDVIADVDLHAAWLGGGWWIIGDAGTVVVSDNEGETWSTTILGDGSVDLLAIDGKDGQPVIVGDEAVFVRLGSGAWTEPPTPEGGWGQLRDVHEQDGIIYAVGLAGVVWSTEDPAGEWVAEATGVGADLLAAGPFGPIAELGPTIFGAVGAGGTVLVRDGTGWKRLNSGTSVDLIDYDTYALGAGGEIFEIDQYGRATQLDLVEGARALSHHYRRGNATVGLGGAATSPPASQTCID